MIPPPTNDSAPTFALPHTSELVRLHLRIGWGALLLFIILGLVLEALHAFKVPFYVDAENETRRLLFRLAHAHGALLCLIHLCASWTFSQFKASADSVRLRLISRCFTGALITLPGGFFLGGFGAVDGDPGMGILLVPPGAVFLAVAVFLLFRALRQPPSS